MQGVGCAYRCSGRAPGLNSAYRNLLATALVPKLFPQPSSLLKRLNIYAGLHPFWDGVRVTTKLLKMNQTRFDSVPVDPSILKWFLERASPNLRCHLVPDILHSKVIWWVEAGAYIGSANLSDRAWVSNIEAGTFFSHNTLVETGMDQELLQFFEQSEDRSHPLTQELYSQQLRLSEQRAGIDGTIIGSRKNSKRAVCFPRTTDWFL